MIHYRNKPNPLKKAVVKRMAITLCVEKYVTCCYMFYFGGWFFMLFSSYFVSRYVLHLKMQSLQINSEFFLSEVVILE